jgi:hypothetical protein
MSHGDIIGLLGVAVVIIGGIIHLHVRVEGIRKDTHWLKKITTGIAKQLGYPIED